MLREIVAPERIVFATSFAGAEGNVVGPATHYGMSPGRPLGTLLTVAFEERAGNKTEVTIRHAGVPPGAERDADQRGWSETLDRLAEHLKKAQSRLGAGETQDRTRDRPWQVKDHD